MDIHTKIIVCTALDEAGSVVRKDEFGNSFKELDEFLSNFSRNDSFVMESTGSYGPLYDFIGSKGFSVKLANTLKMRNDDVDSEVLAKLLRNNWVQKSYVPVKELREIRRSTRN